MNIPSSIFKTWMPKTNARDLCQLFQMNSSISTLDKRENPNN